MKVEIGVDEIYFDKDADVSFVNGGYKAVSTEDVLSVATCKAETASAFTDVTDDDDVGEEEMPDTMEDITFVDGNRGFVACKTLIADIGVDETADNDDNAEDF